MLTGKKILHYTLHSKLGEGGMGVVYQAEDTKLGRTVALKMLPSHLLVSEDDKARFHREAKAAAALSHTNIAIVYEINEFDHTPFIAMEYVEGQTLNHHIAKGPLKLQDAINIAIQVAQGLNAAHAKDIVHRDIKSSNIILGPENQAKILDFGLAKTSLSTKLTQLGSTVGTVAYMSPEQVKGQEVNHRTDLWSLGVVLYEMISGRLPFIAEYEQAIFYGIQNEEAEPLTSIRTGVPMSLEWIVNKLMAKDPGERYQSAKELIIDLKAVDLNERGFSRTGIVSTPAARQTKFKSKPGLKNIGILAAGIMTGIIIAMFGFSFFQGQNISKKQVLRFTLDYSEDSHLYMGEGNPLSISPDGSKIVYSTQEGLYLRYLNDLQNSNLIPDTEDAKNPSFSQDGNWIVFSAIGAIKKVSVLGGQPQRISTLNAKNTTMHYWGDNNTIIFSQMWNSGIFKIDPASGGFVQFNKTDSLIASVLHPQLLPDGNTILYIFQVKQKSEYNLALYNIKSGETTVIDINATYARYFSPGFIVYSVNSEILAVPFDIKKQKITGLAVTIASNVLSNDWATIFSISENGTLIYPFAGTVKKERGQLAIRELNGKTELITLPVRPYEPRFSPDGRLCAFSTKGDNWNIWIYDLEEKIIRPLTENQTHDHFPVWSKNGNYIFSSSYRIGGNGIHKLTRISIDGSQQTEVLLEGHNNEWPGSVTPDGKYMIFRRQNNQGDNDLLKLSLDGSKKITPFLKTPNNESAPTLSPNGKWIAYTSDKSGRYEIYIRPFPGPGGFVQISINGGIEPCWSHDGKILYYSTKRGTEIYRTSFSDKPQLVIGHPELFLENDNWSDYNGGRMHYRNYDISPDGDRFIIGQSKSKEKHQFIIVHNWLEELKAKLGEVDRKL